MTFRLRQIDYTADGRRIVRDKDVVAASLGLGRAAENAIHLPDLAVEPMHARIEQAGPGRITVRSVGSLGFSLDGKTVSEASVDCAAGAELGFGGYRIRVSMAEDGAILLEVGKVVAGTEAADPLEDKRAFSLGAIMPSKRLAGWSLVATILALFLILPVGTHLFRAQPTPAATPTVLASSTVHGDRAWNPGPLSLGHASLTGRCEACHAKPFESVRNQTCLSCHKDLKDHAHADALALARGEPGLGQGFRNGVAHLFGREGPGACTDCHVEHQGAKPMENPRQKFCADCHVGLKQRLPGTKLGDAGDFGTLHPQFAAMVVGNADRRALVRVPLDGHAREDNGLTFSHKVHLDAKGGVARMAMELGAGAGYGKALDCQNCHRPSDDGVRFQPISMERDCEGCHSLAYDKIGGTVRRLRHGDVAQMVADLNAASGRGPVVTGRSRPGEYAAGRLYAANFGGGLAGKALAKDGLCGECHTPQMRDGRLSVRHVTLVSRYMSNGWFDHAAHKQTACTECHAARTSQASSDVLLPGIGECRSCHVGEINSGESILKQKVPSNCVMCHAYHVTPRAPAGARRSRR